MAKVQESVANVLTVCPSQPLVPFEGAKPLAAKDTKHKSSATATVARASDKDSCGVQNTTFLSFVHAVHRCAQFDSSKLSLARRARAVQQCAATVRREVHECV